MYTIAKHTAALLLLLLTVSMACLGETGKGEIRVKMLYGGQPITGGSVTLYDVTDSPEGIGPLEMLVYVKELGIRGYEKQVGSSGEVLFDELSSGKYLLVQLKAAEGFYPVKPFMIPLSLTDRKIQAKSIWVSPEMQPLVMLHKTG